MELLEEMAAVVIGHTWLFHRWLIYLCFGGAGDEEDAARPPKHRHKGGTARSSAGRCGGKEAVCLAPLHFAGETRASLRGNKTSGTKDKRLERAGILPAHRGEGPG